MPSSKGTTRKAGSSATPAQAASWTLGSVSGHSPCPNVTFLGRNFKLCFPRSLGQAVLPGAWTFKSQRARAPGICPGHAVHSSRVILRRLRKHQPSVSPICKRGGRLPRGCLRRQPYSESALGVTRGLEEYRCPPAEGTLLPEHFLPDSRFGPQRSR